MVKGQWKKFTGKSAVWRHNNKDNKMEDINIGAITEALNDKSDRDLRNIDNIAGADAVIDYQEPTADNGYTWYRKYNDGWVEQGGCIPQGFGEAIYVEFPIPMATDHNPIWISIQKVGDEMVKFDNIGVADVMPGGFSCYESDDTYDKYWKTEGMAA